MEKEASIENDSNPDISPSRSSISSEKFFGEDFYGSSNSLDANDSRKNSMSDTELEFRLQNGFKNSNCTIS